MKAAALIGMVLAVCVVPAAWADEQPRPDIGSAVGTVQDGDILYVLVFTFDGGGVISAWNATDGMAPVVPNPFTLTDGHWGPVPGGYKDIVLDGEARTIVAVVGGAPVIIDTVDAVPYTGENTRELGSIMRAQGDGGRLFVSQAWWVGHDLNSTWMTHSFHSVDEDPVELSPGSTVSRNSDPTMVIISIDGQNYAAVNTVEGPPVLVDVMEAASLGLGDITDMRPVDYMRWDVPPRLLSAAIDPSAAIEIFGDGGSTYAAVSAGGQTVIYGITNPLAPVELARVDAAEADAGPVHLLVGCVRCETLAGGTGVAHVYLTNPERAGLDVPKRFVLGAAADRINPEGTWAVAVTVDGGIVLAETDPNTEVAVVRDGTDIWVVERDAGWETVYEGYKKHPSNYYYAYRTAPFGDPGVRAYDMADPSSPEEVGEDALPAAYGGFAEAGRAITAEIGGEAWVLVPVRAESPDGPVMEVSAPGATKRYSSAIHVTFGVRNVHHEPLMIYIDRLTIGKLVLEQRHTYSGFEAPSRGDVRLSGPTTYGLVGPTDAYGRADNRYTVYAVPELDIVYAFVSVYPNMVHLEPGEAKQIEVTFFDPCGVDGDTIPVDGVCGPWDYNLDPERVSGSKQVVLVAEGYPEWVAVGGQ